MRRSTTRRRCFSEGERASRLSSSGQHPADGQEESLDPGNKDIAIPDRKWPLIEDDATPSEMIADETLDRCEMTLDDRREMLDRCEMIRKQFGTADAAAEV